MLTRHDPPPRLAPQPRIRRARVEIVDGIMAQLDGVPNLRIGPEQPAPFMTGGAERRGIPGLPVPLS
jgi:hypothetical protein